MQSSLVPADWMPDARIIGIVVHWTGGPHRATSLDRQHYHVIVEGDGTLVRGTPSIDLNGLPRVRKGYAAHTRNCNSGWIGVSLACMAGATEKPFEPGSAPMTRAQWDALPRVLADLCRRYDIAVTPRSVLSHAEVQPTLGIAQSGKWDIARLAFDPTVKGAAACGDLFRSRTSDLLAAPVPKAAPAMDAVPIPPVALIEATKRRLRDLGYFTVGAIDAQIGPRTIAALSQFQAAAQLPVSGLLDEATMDAIWAKTAPTAPVSAERAAIGASDLAAVGNPIVEAARRGKLAGAMGVALGLAGATWSALNAISPNPGALSHPCVRSLASGPIGCGASPPAASRSSSTASISLPKRPKSPLSGPGGSRDRMLGGGSAPPRGNAGQSRPP